MGDLEDLDGTESKAVCHVRLCVGGQQHVGLAVACEHHDRVVVRIRSRRPGLASQIIRGQAPEAVLGFGPSDPNRYGPVRRAWA